jgi:NADH-quinone oxidoreductase subunit F
MKKITSRMAAGEKHEGDAELLMSVAKQIEGRTVCAFGEACSWPVQAIVNKFREEL